MIEIKKVQTFKDEFEQQYPEIAKEFKKIQEEQYDLCACKMLSYGKGNISMGSNLETEEEVKLSLTSIWIRMSDKMNRLKQLVLLGKTNPLKDESSEDAWIDLSNYSIIALIVKRNKWK